MSRVMAAREKMSDGRGVVCCDVQVLRTGLVQCLAGAQEDIMEEEDDEEEGEEEEFDEVIDAIERRGWGLCIRLELRCCLRPSLLAFVPEYVEDEDEDVAGAKEDRDDETGSPTRIAVPLEAAESGRERSGEDEGLSLSDAKVDCVDRFRRAVRPPDGSTVRAGVVVCCWTRAVVRTQRSGEE